MKNLLISFGPVLGCLVVAIVISLFCGFAVIGLETIFIFGFVLIFAFMAWITIESLPSGKSN